MLEFYIPKQVLESYGVVDLKDPSLFNTVNIALDKPVTVRITPTLLTIYKTIRRKLYGKYLGVDIILTNKHLQESKVFEIRETSKDSSLKLTKMMIIDRILTTHMLLYFFKLLKDLDIKKEFLHIPIEDVKSLSQEEPLTNLFNFFKRKIKMFDIKHCLTTTITFADTVLGIISDYNFTVNAYFQYGLSKMILDEDLNILPELRIKVSDRFLSDLKGFTREYEKRLNDLMDEYRVQLESILEEVYTLETLVLKLLRKNGSFAFTPEIIDVIEIHGYSIQEALEVLRELERKRIVIRERERWILNE